MGFIFGAPGLPKTPQELERMRTIAQALALKDTAAPKNIGEGLTAIGNALAYRSMMGDIAKASDAGTASAADTMKLLTSGFGGQPAPAAAPAVPAAPSIPPEAMGGAPMSDTPAPLSGGFPAKAQAHPDDRQKYAFDFFVNKGYSPVQAAGIVGGLKGETANLNTTQTHDGGIGLGISGWNGPRLVALKDFAQKTGQDPTSLDTQLAFVDQELKSSEGGAYSALQAARTPQQAGDAMLGYFRPKDWNVPGAHGERAQYAAETFNRYGNPQVASLDPNFMPAMGGPPSPQIPPQPLASPDQPMQVAQAGGFMPGGPEGNVTTLRTRPVQPTIGQQPTAQPQAPQASQSGPSPTVQQLMQAVQNPWLSAGQQAVVKSMLEQKLKEQDPTHQIDLQLKQAQLKNAIGAPESVRALQERARLAGLQPGTLAYNQFMATGGASRQTIAPPEKGMRYVYDQNGNVVSEEPVPGGSVARAEAEKEAAKKLSGNLVMQDIDRAMGMADGWTTGPGGALLQNTPGSSAHDMQQLLQGVKANVGFDRLQQMRSQSPTGGALGQVSEQENRLLQSTMGSLEQSQTKAQFLENLGRLKSIYVDIVHGTPAQRAEMVRQGKLTEAENAAIESMKTARMPAAQQGTPPKAGNYKYNPATGKLEPVQ